MRLIAEQLADLAKVDVPLTRRDDFDAFWAAAVDRVEQHEPDVKMTQLTEYPLDHVSVYDSIFHGLDGTPVKTWVLLPESAEEKPVPAIVWYHGGNGNRGLPYQHIHWVMAGFAVMMLLDVALG